MKYFFWLFPELLLVYLLHSIFPIFYQYPEKQENNPYIEYYTTENTVAVSPHDLRLEMDKWLTDTIIVDLRTAQEYSHEHIRWAINIPGIANDANAEAQEKRIVQAFSQLPKNKQIIIHCYTHYCMLAKHIWLMLAKNEYLFMN